MVEHGPTAQHSALEQAMAHIETARTITSRCILQAELAIAESDMVTAQIETEMAETDRQANEARRVLRASGLL